MQTASARIVKLPASNRFSNTGLDNLAAVSACENSAHHVPDGHKAP